MNRTRFSHSFISTICLFAVLSNSAYSATTEEKLNACDAALTAKKEEASLCGLGVQLRQSEIERVTKENAALRDRSSSVLANPFVWAAIGVIFGTWAGARVTR